MQSKINLAYVVLLSSVAALGGLMFGFDIAIITGANPFIEAHFQLSKIQLGICTSSLLFGCIFGSFFAGRLTDRLGRKIILFQVSLLFALTSLATALAPSFWFYTSARFIGGLAVGAASMVSPLYISEVAPSKIRGRLVSFYQLSIVLGILISYLINFLLKDVGDANWRWMFATGIIPSVVLFILLYTVPETPRFLVKSNRDDEALAVLMRINDEETARREFKQIEDSLVERKGRTRDLLKPEYRMMMFVGIGLAFFVQTSGINAIIDYSPFIFKAAGWKMDAALFATFGLGIVNTVFTFVAIYAIDKVGRKMLYLIGSAGMTGALFALAAVSHLGLFQSNMVLALCILYLVFFTSCIGPVFWTLTSEIFPNRIRGVAMSVPVFTQWFFNALVVLLFPWMLDNIPTLTFIIIGMMALLQFLFTYKFVPETKGKTLEEIEQHWKSLQSR
jgi:SP family arabinose:H+ symporter-like MFS transporter